MQPTLSEYLEGLANRYRLHYDVETNKTISGQHVDIYALSIIDHYRNVLTKEIKMDNYQEREIILVRGFEDLVEEREMNNFSQFLTKVTREMVIPSFDVMSHTINGIIVSAQGFSPETVIATQRFRYSKTFFLGIKGWCDVRLLLIDIKNSSVFCNAKGREVAPVYSFQKRVGGGEN
jgi:hypothetical protein